MRVFIEVFIGAFKGIGYGSDHFCRLLLIAI